MRPITPSHGDQVFVMGLGVIGIFTVALLVIGAILIGHGEPGVIGLSKDSQNFQNISGRDSAGQDIENLKGYYPVNYYQGGLLGLLRVARTSPRTKDGIQ